MMEAPTRFHALMAFNSSRGFNPRARRDAIEAPELVQLVVIEVLYFRFLTLHRLRPPERQLRS